ncbi:putative CoA-substrate-specific enzyme activase [delta proteobacterium NaphS2]|nr:putative CoA-substrate-specific enzyme activase [delta proteobacterium NaphS2]
MNDHGTILGIDMGSVAISAAQINFQRRVLKTAYQFHHGNREDAFIKMMKGFDVKRICGIAVTSSTPSTVRADRRYDNRVAIIEAARHFHDKIGAILVVGGEAFGLIGFDQTGRYRSFKTNTACAAGTGSFLDQQAQRLRLESARALGEKALNNRGEIPKIASRCAVFAKTDLVHAQQEGYSLEQICDGLCYGLAKNIVDRLSVDREPLNPVIFTGGVSRNRAVVDHIRAISEKEIIVDETGVYGAVGVAFLMADAGPGKTLTPFRFAEDMLRRSTGKKEYFHAPLQLTLSHYPEFDGVEKYEYMNGTKTLSTPVEVDIYETLTPPVNRDVFLGVDIGSTSTKAVLLDTGARVLAGFYTGTAGRPVAAVQRLFSAINDMAVKKKFHMLIRGAATTGSGRKFAGKIMGADIILDEITAHARAACEINPEVDTIIEIGGQDSKFTTMKDGRVTFSVMNNVCAAGTGSFIEEQARKLDCPLSDYSARTEGRQSPMVSDRCTVFMERDMNHYLSLGYTVDEVLASALHAIRENYLTKVATMGAMGDTIFFQGATAKNMALVAAFEQRLQKPIHVSRYCHLTGAMGAALSLLDEGMGEKGSSQQTRFRGISLHEKKINITSEICDLCTNHCKITVAHMAGEKVAYGFLCGREYDTQRYVNRNLSGFDLLKERQKVFHLKFHEPHTEQVTIGIPAALHLFEDLPFWRKFFDALSIGTITSENYNDALKVGKHVADAEFCAPIVALHGHVQYLMTRSDAVFLPFYLEKKASVRGLRRQYCYYTQFAPSLISKQHGDHAEKRILTPLIRYLHSTLHTKIELYNTLKAVTKAVKFLDVSKAYDTAREYQTSCLLKLKALYREELDSRNGIHVVLLGRPYTALSKTMNKSIPDIFASLGIRVYYQDMLPYSQEETVPIQELLGRIHWRYAAEILTAAQVTATNERAYPVLVTSFRCSPDAFVMDYFKEIMAAHHKPYLILQLDEHESNVGYETRIEAAIRSFQNHHALTRRKVPVSASARFPVTSKDLSHKTLIIPNWDNITFQFLAANLRREGIDARLMEESRTTIQKSLRYNTGQCIPLNIIAQEFVEYVSNHHLDPEKTLLWMVSSKIACNIGLFPHHLERLFHAYGNGMEKTRVYVGDMSFLDVSLKLPINTYFAHMFGGFIRKMGCRIRPYEKQKGATDRVIEESVSLLVDAFSGKASKEEALKEVIASFEAIDIHRERKPKVAIFGDLYVRDNDVMNQDLIRFIESHNGEVIVTPYSAYVQMIARAYLKKWFFEGNYLDILSSKALLATVTRLEKSYLRYFHRILDPEPAYHESPEKILSEYNVRIEHTGESMDNLLKIFYTKKRYPDVALFVQASPAFCCPSLVTEAMAKTIEKKTGVPMVSITYDGTSTHVNNAIVPYLTYLKTVDP